MPPGSCRLFLLEHRRLVRSLFEIALQHEPDIHLIGAAEGVDDARAQLAPLVDGVDVAIVDLLLPGDAAVSFLPELHAAWPTCRILVLEPVESFRRRALAVASGAAGVLSRNATFPETVAMIRRAHAGEALIEPRDLHGLLRSAAQFRAVEEGAHAKFARLTARELEVLRALARGRSDKEIAAELNIKAKTVATHVANVLEKLHVASRLQAVLQAIEFGAIELGFT